jgi:hypothetical protein
MNTPNAPDLAAENAELRARLAEVEETLDAIRSGGDRCIVRADGYVRWLAGLGRFAYAGKPGDSAPEGKPEPERL